MFKVIDQIDSAVFGKGGMLRVCSYQYRVEISLEFLF